MSINYSPWGNIDWITSKLADIERWNFLGSISTEERSLGAWIWLMSNKKIASHEMWKIIDTVNGISSPYKKLNDMEFKKRIIKYNNNGGQNKYREFLLLESDTHATDKLNSFIDKTDGNIIVDISTMPKRWFFPVIKECLQDTRIMNLLILYTLPKFYSKKQGEDPMTWRCFPSFCEMPEREEIEKYFIISAGYQPLSLPEWISSNKKKVHILFPFPSSINGYTRVWDFIRAVESDCGKIENGNIHYVSGFDLPVIYQSISDIIKKEKNKEPIFIPYGPKPISLAFSMLASSMQFPVGYTQPMYYNPYYSKGIATTANETPKTMSYLLKLDGKQMYIPPKVDF